MAGGKGNHPYLEVGEGREGTNYIIKYEK